MLRMFGIALAILVATGQSAWSLTRAPIQIDGEFSDWSAVLIDSANVVVDRSIAQGDPDAPDKDERDLRAFGFTYDDENLYFYFKRSKRGHGIAVVYIDLDYNQRLDPTDRIVTLHYHDDDLKEARLYPYIPAMASDPLTGDGVDEPGSGNKRDELPNRISGFGDDELQFEAAVPLSDLGLAPGAVVCFHPALSDKKEPDDYPDKIKDNGDSICTAFHDLDVRADSFGAAEPGGCASYSHVLENRGNVPDTIDLRLTSTLGGSVSLYTDPNGDGDPADGVLVAIDADGNGSFFDIGDMIDPAFDTNLNDLPDFVLAPGESVNLVLVVCLAGSSPGDEDVLTLTARSSEDPLVFGITTDRTKVGVVQVFPDRTGSSVDDSFIDFAHTVCNTSGATDVIALEAVSSNAWTVVIFSDPDGDGSPIDGMEITELGPLADGECASIVVRVMVPAGEPVGTTDQTTVTATLASSGDADTAVDTTTVADAVTFFPDNNGISAPAGTKFYPHTIVNSTTTAINFGLSEMSSLGSGVTYWSDPNGDGEVDDGMPITNTGAVPAWGGQVHIVVQVDIPSTAGEGDIDNLVTTATALDTSGLSATVTDVTQVRNLVTYADALFVRPTPDFPPCVSIFARAHNLKDKERYKFIWIDAFGNLRRVSPLIKADNQGRVDDQLDLTVSDPAGIWTVKVQDKDGNDIVPGGSTEFNVVGNQRGTGGVISQLTTDRVNYVLTGDSLLMRATMSNPSQVTYQGSFADYLIFMDADGDGAPTDGESFIQLDGNPGVWTAGRFTCRSGTIPDLPPGEDYLDESCLLSVVNFPTAGTWTLCAEWFTVCGSVIDSSCVEFNVGCAPGDMPTADAGPPQQMCSGATELDAIQIGEIGDPSLLYEWLPTTNIDDPNIANPMVWPQETTTYTLTVTDPTTGCVNRPPACPTCEVEITVVPTPDADAGPSQAYCADQAGVVIGLPQAPSVDCSWDPVDGLADPNACETVADPGIDTQYTLTVTDPTNGCFSTDVMVVTVNALPIADAGPDTGLCEVGGTIQLGTPAIPGLSYSWEPVDTLNDPSAAQPIAAPTADTVYTLTVIDDATGCSVTDQVTVGVSARPGLIVLLKAVKASIDVRFVWTQDPVSLGGYHAYRVTDKTEIPVADVAGTRVVDTLESPAENRGYALGDVPGIGGDVYFYQVVGVCSDGVTEGPI